MCEEDPKQRPVGHIFIAFRHMMPGPLKQKGHTGVISQVGTDDVVILEKKKLLCSHRVPTKC